MRLIYNKYVQTSSRLTCLLNARAAMGWVHIKFDGVGEASGQVGLHGLEAGAAEAHGARRALRG